MKLAQVMRKLGPAEKHILTVWSLRRPKMVKELLDRDWQELVNKVKTAEDQRADYIVDQIRAKIPVDQARELATAIWVMIPAEEEEPIWSLNQIL